MHALSYALLCLAGIIQAGTVAASLLPSCKAGFKKTLDASGSCGVYECTGANGESYCPCPFLYKDASATATGATCICLVPPVCGDTCPAGYISNASGCVRSTKAPDKSQFKITLINMGAPQQYEAIFAKAAAKWESIITADLTDRDAADAPEKGWFDGFFTTGKDYFGAIDDIVIGYTVRKIDGVGKTLAQSTPLWTRAGQAQDAGLPLSGAMEFDVADVQDGFKDGSLLVTVTHEMGHVLGIGTLWNEMPNKCASTCDVYAAGNVSECVASDKAVELGLPDPLLVENEGTANDGTYCGHWSEAQLKNELMTGSLSPLFLYNPLSAITIGGLKDLGYTVDFSKAEPLVEPKARREARLLQQAAYIAAGGTDTGVRYLQNDIIDWPIKQHVPRHLR